MLTNMEHQLREQGASDKFDEVLAEIPRVRKDLGYIPLVTPTSQIVGTQSVINILMGERYKTIAKETAGVLRGEYGATPAPVDAELQSRVLDQGEQAITCRPADLIEPEMQSLIEEFAALTREHDLQVKDGEDLIDDVLSYALFQQVGLNFIQNRGNPSAFEPAPQATASQATSEVKNEAGDSIYPVEDSTSTAEGSIYTVEVEGKSYVVTVNDGGDLTSVTAAANSIVQDTDDIDRAVSDNNAVATTVPGGEPVTAPLAGNVIAIPVVVGQKVSTGDTIIVLEAMKMETNISAPHDGHIADIKTRQGEAVSVGDILLTIS